jgi:TonB family protein
LLFYLGERPSPLPPPVRFGARLHLAADPWTTERVAGLPALSDPTLFALPTRHGFSGGAWLDFAPLRFAPWQWTEPPPWLTVQTQALGRGFAALVSLNTANPLRVADKPMPRVVGLAAPVPAVPLRNRSELRLSGDLAGRRLLEPIALPAWPHTDLLSNSVVQVVVDGEGRVLAATLLSGSGRADADEYAVRAATAARFEPEQRGAMPAGSEVVVRGRLTFQWHTVPPPAAEAVPEL